MWERYRRSVRDRMVDSADAENIAVSKTELHDHIEARA